MNSPFKRTVFQGNLKNHNKNYFEGWYYKQVNTSENFVISFIPGISLNKKDPHCFIQCLIHDNDILTSYYFRYSLSEFSDKKEPFSVKIGNSIFCENTIHLDLKNESINIIGDLVFNNIESLKTSLFIPNIMGVFSYIPGMECNHHIISMHHFVNGNLKLNNRLVSFTNGAGYIEKDWGRSFPNEYIWLQCNNFKDMKTRITFSVANIPFSSLSFQGFFCVLIIENNQYIFSTYNCSKLKINSLDKNNLDITLYKSCYELNIIGHINDVKSLASPINGNMINSIKEGLDGKVKIILKNNKDFSQLMNIGINAGIEIMMTK